MLIEPFDGTSRSAENPLPLTMSVKSPVQVVRRDIVVFEVPVGIEGQRLPGWRVPKLVPLHRTMQQATLLATLVTIGLNPVPLRIEVDGVPRKPWGGLPYEVHQKAVITAGDATERKVDIRDIALNAGFRSLGGITPKHRVTLINIGGLDAGDRAEVHDRLTVLSQDWKKLSVDQRIHRDTTVDTGVAPNGLSIGGEEHAPRSRTRHLGHVMLKGPPSQFIAEPGVIPDPQELGYREGGQ